MNDREIASLYTELGPKVRSWLVANGADDALAGDLVQEAFLRLWRRREELDPSLVSGLVWTVVKNLRLDHFRHAKFTVSSDDPEGGTPEVSVGPAASPSDAVYLRRRIDEALSELSEDLRNAYVLFQEQELSIREIARRTDASETLVKVRIHRARLKLRESLKDLRRET